MKALRLELGANVLDFDDWAIHGVVVTTVDLGFPAVREVSTALPTQDGSYDETAFVGPRVVTLTGNVGPGTNGSRSSARGALAPFLAPSARPTLVVALDDDAAEMELTMRATDFTSVAGPGGSSSPFTASWTCPDPIAYGTGTNEVDLRPATAGSAGRTYPKTFSYSYPVTLGGGGTSFITTNGDYGAFPVIQIDGPVTNPVITWLDPVTRTPSGPQIVISGLTVAAGTYLEIDTKARTVYLNGDPNYNRFPYLDFEATIWAPLQAGTNLLRFTTPSSAPPAIARVFWRDAFLV